jgi:hypothetical protein
MMVVANVANWQRNGIYSPGYAVQRVLKCDIEHKNHEQQNKDKDPRYSSTIVTDDFPLIVGNKHPDLIVVI